MKNIPLRKAKRRIELESKLHETAKKRRALEQEYILLMQDAKLYFRIEDIEKKSNR